MANHSAKAIANEFLLRRGDDSTPSQMQIQKLAYVAHGWNLAINGEPLIAESPEAWDNGPVFRSIWDHVKDWGYGVKSCLLTDPFTKRPYTANISDKEKAVIDHVWERYKKYSGIELSTMTHKPGTPWFKAYYDRRRNAPLLNDDILDHYTRLALAGRGK